MKLTDKIISRFGVDKLLHFTIAGWLISLVDNISPIAMIITTIIIILLSIIKEKVLDNKEDWNDVYAALIGIATSWFWYFVF